MSVQRRAGREGKGEGGQCTAAVLHTCRYEIISAGERESNSPLSHLPTRRQSLSLPQFLHSVPPLSIIFFLLILAHKNSWLCTTVFLHCLLLCLSAYILFFLCVCMAYPHICLQFKKKESCERVRVNIRDTLGDFDSCIFSPSFQFAKFPLPPLFLPPWSNFVEVENH